MRRRRHAGAVNWRAARGGGSTHAFAMSRTIALECEQATGRRTSGRLPVTYPAAVASWIARHGCFRRSSPRTTDTPSTRATGANPRQASLKAAFSCPARCRSTLASAEKPTSSCVTSRTGFGMAGTSDSTASTLATTKAGLHATQQISLSVTPGSGPSPGSLVDARKRPGRDAAGARSIPCRQGPRRHGQLRGRTCRTRPLRHPPCGCVTATLRRRHKGDHSDRLPRH